VAPWEEVREMGERVVAVDVVIVGGGPAGLAAALYLGRARRGVVVIDQGSPRHGVSASVHNFLTREGTPPAMLRELAWSQMAAYPSVGRHEGAVEAMSWSGEAWEVRAADGARWRARAALLATGVVDEHPSIPGYQERWGHSIHHCPFCHGWESRELPLAVLASGEGAAHLPRMLRGWSQDVILLTNGAALGEGAREALEGAKIPIYTQEIARLEGPAPHLDRVVFKDGGAVARKGLFVAAPQRQVGLVQRLGAALDEQGYVKVDAQLHASLPMLWAAGDLTSRMQQVGWAAAQGGLAGAMIAATLIMG
jgi:thioredoxin reductase